VGLADRDYMRERREPGRPAFAPPEPTLRITLWSIVSWIGIAILCFRAISWWNHRHDKPVIPPSSPADVVIPVGAQPSERPEPRAAGVSPNRASVITTPSTTYDEPRSNVTAVKRCVVAGKTTFTDGPCSAEATTSTMTIHTQRNVADSSRSVPVQPPVSVPNVIVNAPPPIVIQAAPQPDPYFVAEQQRKAECAFHEESIKSIDIQARQALSGQQQDYLAAERKKHRDEQYRLRC
jgi:hypothetical protein